MRGFKDILPPLSIKFEKIAKIFADLCKLFSVNFVELPLVEEADLYFRSSGAASDICNKELFEVRKYKGDFSSWVLRPEGTASCLRAVKDSNFLIDNKVCRLGYYGPMFRYNRPQKGRYRQFFQAGWEWLGSSSKFSDLEIVLGACQLLDLIGIEYSLEINSIGNIEDRANYRQILRSHFNIVEDPFKKLDQLSLFDGIPQMCLNAEDSSNFAFVFENLQTLKKPVIHNPYLIRGLDYYNGLVFEFKSQGQTILAGGRYDGLMQQLGGPHLPAIGFALGVDRVVERLLGTSVLSDDIALISLDDIYAFQVLEKVRNFGYPVLPLWGMTLRSALQFSSKKFKYAIIVGSNESNKGTFLIKNFELSLQKELILASSLENLLHF